MMKIEITKEQKIINDAPKPAEYTIVFEGKTILYGINFGGTQYVNHLKEQDLKQLRELLEKFQ